MKNRRRRRTSGTTKTDYLRTLHCELLPYIIYQGIHLSRQQPGKLILKFFGCRSDIIVFRGLLQAMARSSRVRLPVLFINLAFVFIISFIIYQTKDGLIFLLRGASIVNEGTMSEYLQYPYRGSFSSDIVHTLPLRKADYFFAELTSSNRLSESTLTMDFNFFVRYEPSSVVIYEDYGPGCVTRIYDSDFLIETGQVPNATGYMVVIEMDGSTTRIPYGDALLSIRYPFLSPFAHARHSLQGGVLLHYPLCYSTRALISIEFPIPFGYDLRAHTMDCMQNWFTCRHKHYYAVSRLKFPSAAFIDNALFGHHIKPPPYQEDVWQLIRRKDCALSCISLPPHQQTAIIRKDGAFVLNKFLFQVWTNGALKEHLRDIWIDVSWDEDPMHHYQASLGLLVGWLKDWAQGTPSLLHGTTIMECMLLGQIIRDHVGYILFPMPFWRKAEISVLNVSPRTVDFCFDMDFTTNSYGPGDSGYFGLVQHSYHGDLMAGWKEVLNLSNRWGHVVGISIEDRYVHKDVEEADMLVYVDGSPTPTLMGTGVEDYFGCSYHCNLDGGNSHLFSGAYYIVGTTANQSSDISRAYYRLQLFDPIPFRSDIIIALEGLKGDGRYLPMASSNFELSSYLLDKMATTMTTLALFYSRPKMSHDIRDFVELSSKQSRVSHDVEWFSNDQHFVPSLNVVSSHLLGDYIRHEKLRYHCCNVHEGIELKFKLRTTEHHRLVVLRRLFHSAQLSSWSHKVHVVVNGVQQGIWFFPYGTTDHQASLRSEDLPLNPRATRGRNHVRVSLFFFERTCEVSFTALTFL